MAHRTDQPPEQPSPAPTGNPLVDAPATVQACQGDYGTDDATARDQLALARAHGNEQGGTR